ncbi:MAG: hypothetical protein KBS74_04200 [Clostridiales bacterium]|nr:hypothetical protein [Candidatus Cacconaster stercorequi]
MKRNTMKEQLRAQQKPLGIFVGTGSSTVVECIGRTGFDYVVIDNEHSPVEAETSAALIRAAELSGLTPLARVRDLSRPAVLKLLDVGAQGLVVPDIRTAAEAREIVSYCKYSPIGNRGFCPSRKDGWGFDGEMSVRETMDFFNDNVLLFLQCETAEALSSIEEIAAVEGVDGIFIGPFDLSISMGIPGEFDNPVFTSALARVRKAARDAGKFCVIFAGTPDKAIENYGEGYDSVAYQIDAGLLIACFREKVHYIKSNRS